MKCHILFSEKNKKNISKCRLLKILPRVLSVNGQGGVFCDNSSWIYLASFSIKVSCGYSLEVSCRGTTNEYQQYMLFKSEIRKIS